MAVVSSATVQRVPASGFATVTPPQGASAAKTASAPSSAESTKSDAPAPAPALPQPKSLLVSSTAAAAKPVLPTFVPPAPTVKAAAPVALVPATPEEAEFSSGNTSRLSESSARSSIESCEALRALQRRYQHVIQRLSASPVLTTTAATPAAEGPRNDSLPHSSFVCVNGVLAMTVTVRRAQTPLDGADAAQFVARWSVIRLHVLAGPSRRPSSILSKRICSWSSALLSCRHVPGMYGGPHGGAAAAGGERAGRGRCTGAVAHRRSGRAGRG